MLLLRESTLYDPNPHVNSLVSGWPPNKSLQKAVRKKAASKGAHLHWLKSPGNKKMSSSDRFPLTPTGEKQNIFLTNGSLLWNAKSCCGALGEQTLGVLRLESSALLKVLCGEPRCALNAHGSGCNVRTVEMEKNNKNRKHK